MKIAVLMGGNSPERNVSLNSGKAVANALQQNNHSVVCIDPALGESCILNIENIDAPATPPTREELEALPVQNFIKAVLSDVFNDVDVVFSVLHGENGEDGIMQALLQARGLRYTGSKVMASALAMDKAQSKIIFSATGVPTPAWAVVTQENAKDYDLLKDLRDGFRGSLVVKPNDQGSTVGMTIIENGNLDEMEVAVATALQYSSVAVVEQLIPGRELTVAVIGDEAYPIIEIAPEGGFYDYEHKYTKGMSQYICPAELDDELSSFIQNLAITAHKACGCSGYSRVDFRLDDDNHPWCLEVNTLPGMTATSLVPKAAAAADMDFITLCERIIELA